MTHWTLPRLQAFCAAHLAGVTVHAFAPLQGGFWNQVLCLQTSQGTLVFKQYRPIPEGALFPNLPADEALALQRLAGLNVAPDLIAAFPAENILIYRHVPGPEWQSDVTAVARLMQRQSQADATGFRPVPTQPAQILAQADTILATCQPDDITRALHAARPIPQPSPPAPLCLIHTDPAPANLVGHDLRLIDWQCPAAGDLAEDVSVFFSHAFLTLYQRPLLTPDQRAHFLQTLADPALTARLPLLEPAYAYRLAAYCCHRMQTTPDAALAQRYRAAALAEVERLQDPVFTASIGRGR